MEEAVKHLPHTLHTCGFSPVWILRCVFRLELVLNPLLQKSHL